MDENEELKALYRDFYKEPLSDLAEKMLHTSYEDKSSVFRKTKKSEIKKEERKRDGKMKKWKNICRAIIYGSI